MDIRILKAVAIEHSKDADAAVNDILTEVLPYMASTSKNGTNNNLGNSCRDVWMPNESSFSSF